METRTEVINYINSLDTYEGYIQFSHRPIDKEKDIFLDKKIDVKDERGFIYEAHFCNGINSIQIRQVNESWLVSATDLTNEELDISYEEYISDIENFPYKIKMAQIWEEAAEEELCENMKVKKLKKVVFAGFVKGESNDNSTI